MNTKSNSIIFFSLSLFLFLLSLQPPQTAAAAADAPSPASASSPEAASTLTGASSPAAADPNLVETACSKYADKNKCVELLTAAPADQKANLKGLIFYSLKEAEKNATKTAEFIEGTLNNAEESLAPYVQQALTECKDHYETLVELIGDAVNAAVSDSNNDVVKYASAAITDADGCKSSLDMIDERSSKENLGALDKKMEEAEIVSLKNLLNMAISIAQCR